MSFDRGVLMCLAVLVLISGVACLLAPATVGAQAGFTLGTGGLTEVRAFYGGFQIGLGAFLVWCLGQPGLTRVGLLLEGFAVGCIGVARALGLLLDAAPTNYHLANLAVEAATVALVAFALARQRKAAPIAA